MDLLRINPVDIEAHQDIPLGPLYAVEREGVGDAAVNQRTVLPPDRSEHRRNGDGGPDGLEQRAFPENDLLAGEQIGRNGRERDGQIFDIDLRHLLADGVDDPFAFDQVVAADREIHQGHHLHRVEPEEPPLERFQAAGGEDAAHQRTGRGAGHRSDFISPGEQFLDRTDIGESARTAAGKGKGYFFHASFFFRFPVGGRNFSGNRPSSPPL